MRLPWKAIGRWIARVLGRAAIDELRERAEGRERPPESPLLTPRERRALEDYERRIGR